VTGAARGIGRACAEALAADGWQVAVAYRSDEADARAVLSDIEATGGTGIVVRLDLLEEESIADAFREVTERLGPVTGLVNNAGYSKDGLIVKYPVETYDRTMDTNVRGAYLCSQAALRSMLRARWGRIVNVSSAIAIRANAGQSAYATSKTALLGLTRGLAREVGGRGITVNAVCPGLVATDMTSHLGDDAQAFYVGQTPVGRTARLEEVAAAVVFLMSNGASYVNGVALPVDGGLTA
jgi:3-oxoacyl-[acyl-carrier protein] reductase